MPHYEQYMPRSEKKNYIKGGLASILVLFLLGGFFIGSVHLVVWLFG